MTTPTRTRATAPPRRVVAEVVRGIGAILVLLVLIAGIPVALLLLGHALAIHVNATSLSQVLTRPDDGSLFLLALQGVAWIGWAAFAFSALLEVMARVRGIPAPALPAISVTQRGAASLIATAAVLLTPTTHWTPTAATPTLATTTRGVINTVTTRPAQPSTAARTPSGEARGDVGTAHQQRAAAALRYPSVTVHRYDTFWGLAERYLGAGTRYPEIVALNQGRPQADGGTVRDADTLRPGWILRLPTDAAHLPTPTPTPSRDSSAAGRDTDEVSPAAGEQRTYLVRPGDTLWDIAEDTLGDPLRFSQIFRLNRGLPQPDGSTLVDPRLIMPGWRLLLPPRATVPTAKIPAPAAPLPPTPGPPSNRVSPSVTPPGHGPMQIPPRTAHPVTSPPIVGGIPAADGPTGPPVTAAISPAPVPTVATPARPRLEQPSTDPDDPSPLSGELVLGMSAVAATGLIAELTRRRRRQQAHRRFGDRIAMPPPQVARTEATLKSTVTPITVDSVRRALRQLADTCQQAGRALPELRLLRIGPGTVQAHLDRPEPVGIAPFTALGPTHWQLDPDQVASDAANLDVAEPYPALLTLGVSEAHQVLLNLDAVGTLTITGEDQDTLDAVLRAVAVDLAIGPLSATALPTFTACFQDLASALDPSRVRYTADPARAERDLTTRLTAAPTGTPGPEAEPTSILLSPVPLTIRPAPHSGAAVIHTGPDTDATTTLRITDEASAVLEPGPLHLTPQRLSPQDYQHIVTMLAIADRPGYRPNTGQTQHPSDELGTAQITAVDVSAATDRVAAEPINAPAEPGEIPEQNRARPALTSQAATESEPAPRVLLLGTVRIQGPATGSAPGRQRKLTELIAYLALHPQASGDQIDEALWPGRRVPRNTRSTTVHRARHWLGADPTGELYLPQLRDQELTYRLHQDITTDWEQFQELARRGLRSPTDGLTELDAALRLVRGRPFLGIDPAGYIWAEPLIQTMIATIADVAHLAAATHLEAGTPRAALQAALTGLDVDEASELLLADAEHAATLAGDQPALARLQQRRQDDDE